MRTIESAIIGSGFMGSAHIEALNRIGGVNVHTLVSDDTEQANALAERFQIKNVSADWHDVVKNDQIEVVHNCTPNNLHFEINKVLLESGKHIISEKPLTTTSAESKELINIAEKTGLVTAINFNYRFYPLMQHAHQMIKTGEVGDIYLVHGHYLQDWLFYESDYNWRLESNISGASRAIADIGSHWCDMVQFITGLKIDQVCADLVTIHATRKKPAKAAATFKGKEEKQADHYESIPIDTEDAGSVLLRFENGARGVFTVSQVSAGRKNHFSFEIDGSKKALAWNQEEPNQLWVGFRDKANEIIIKDPALLADEARQYAHYPGGHPEGYPDVPKNLFLRVYDFIRTGKDPRNTTPDFPTFNDGHIENKIVDAILKSNREQKWVAV